MREPVRHEGGPRAQEMRLSSLQEGHAHAVFSRFLRLVLQGPIVLDLFCRRVMKCKPVVTPPAEHATNRPQRKQAKDAIERPKFGLLEFK